MPLGLSVSDRVALAGEAGEGTRLAMRLVVAMAEAQGAGRLIDIASAHVDGCLYHGEVSLDLPQRLADGGAGVRVPTTLNVGSVDLIHPERFRGDPLVEDRGRRLMELYMSMGCRPTFTCAPYQLRPRPSFGQHVAWGESNAIAFANSVLGARTERYGDFIDIAAAVTGRVPEVGLHTDAGRRGRVLVRLRGVPHRLLGSDALFPVLGHLIGLETGTAIPVIDGLPPSTTEDQLKALGAAAASSGSVGLFHVVGVTPEAASTKDAFHGREPETVADVTPDRLVAARDDLSSVPDGRIGAVSLGTPHLSAEGFARLGPLIERFPPSVPVYVSTGRDVLHEVERSGLLGPFGHPRIRLVVDTCTYVTPILTPEERPVMTDSGKWAWYAPGNLGIDVVFGSTEECVRSAAAGSVWRDATLWGSM